MDLRNSLQSDKGYMKTGLLGKSKKRAGVGETIERPGGMRPEPQVNNPSTFQS